MPKLTDRLLAGLKLQDGRKDRMVFDNLCPGLGVRLTARGTRTFVAQWTDPASKRKVRESVGIWGNLTIDQARDATRTRLGAVAKGINPKTERHHQRVEAERQRAEMSLTFDALVSEWAKLHLVHRRRRYAVEAERALRHSLAELMKLPAARITRTDAVRALDKLASAGKSAMASRTLAYARACYRWAIKRGKLFSNPFQDLPISTSVLERERFLTDTELRAVWTAASGLTYPFGPFFQMAILTLQRRDEVAGMRWSEVSECLTLWTIPGARMKNGRPHDVHLSEVARAVLRSVSKVEGCDFVFSTTGKSPISGFSKGKLALDSAIAAASEPLRPNPMPAWRLHDLRRTGVSTLARLGFDSIVADKLLAHKPAKLRGVAAVYQRHDFGPERKRALDAWANHVISGECSSNVVALRKSS